jgi:hypothetical protein
VKPPIAPATLAFNRDRSSRRHRFDASMQVRGGEPETVAERLISAKEQFYSVKAGR